MTFSSGKVTKAYYTKCITKLARPTISQVLFSFYSSLSFFVRSEIFNRVPSHQPY